MTMIEEIKTPISTPVSGTPLPSPMIERSSMVRNSPPPPPPHKPLFLFLFFAGQGKMGGKRRTRGIDCCFPQCHDSVIDF